MNIRDALKTRKGQLIAVCILLVFSQVFLFFTLGKSYLKNLPNEAKIQKAQKELEKQKLEYAKYNAEKRSINKTRQKYRALAAQAWINSHDGVVETTLRRRISDVAAKLQFRLNNIGAVRTGRINNEFYYAEIDISGSGDIGDVMKLFAALRKIEPVLSWRRLDLRPDFRFRRNTGVGSSNLASRLEIPPTRLNFNGALRVVCYDGPLTVRALKITRPSLQNIDRNAASAGRSPLRPVIPQPASAKPQEAAK